MEAKNGYILPPELLLHVLSYLPQKELTKKVNRVCNYWNQLCLSPSLWTDVSFHEVYGYTLQVDEHILLIQYYVIKLVINPNVLRTLFNTHKTLKFHNLEKLDISMKFILSDDLIDTLTIRCPNIKDLRLFIDNRINIERCFASLSRFQLIEIHFGSCNSRQKIDEYFNILLSKQLRLQKLEIRYVKNIESETVAKILDKCQCLKSLCISNNNIAGLAFTHSMKPLELTELVINSNFIDDSELKCITERAKQLRTLNIKHCKLITDDGLRHVGNCQFLEKICFGNTNTPEATTNQTDCGLISVAEGCYKIKYFQSIGWRNLNDDIIMKLVRSWVHLSYVLVTGCTSLTDISLIAIGKHCPNLTVISFNNCCNISLSGVLCIISSCKHLRRLLLLHCAGISDAGLEIMEKAKESVETIELSGDFLRGAIRRCCFDSGINTTVECAVGGVVEYRLTDHMCKCYHSHLKELALRSCPNISAQTVLKLASLCPDLCRLSLSNCNIQQNEDFIRQLAGRCTLLRTLFIGAKEFDLTV